MNKIKRLLTIGLASIFALGTVCLSACQAMEDIIPETYGEWDDGERFAFFSMAVVEFMQKYELLKQDKQFIDEITIREQVWRVLILGQKGFSEENKIEFDNLPEECQLIDYYDDCIIARVDENTDSIAK